MAKFDWKDKQGVPLARGDWKARKQDLKEHLEQDAPKKNDKLIVIPEITHACLECGQADGTVLFGTCISCHDKIVDRRCA